MSPIVALAAAAVATIVNRSLSHLRSGTIDLATQMCRLRRRRRIVITIGGLAVRPTIGMMIYVYELEV